MAVTAILAKFGLPVLTKVVGSVLGNINNDKAKAASEALDAVSGALNMGEITPEQTQEANRHIEEMAKLEMERDKAALKEVNATIRAEVQSTDPYVRRMRPTFGYIMAIAFGVQMLGLTYAIIFMPTEAPALIRSAAELTTVWGIGLSVLGVYIKVRSDDKAVSATGERKTIMDMFKR